MNLNPPGRKRIDRRKKISSKSIGGKELLLSVDNDLDDLKCGLEELERELNDNVF